jgi:hypothetical protein
MADLLEQRVTSTHFYDIVLLDSMVTDLSRPIKSSVMLYRVQRRNTQEACKYKILPVIVISNMAQFFGAVWSTSPSTKDKEQSL